MKRNKILFILALIPCVLMVGFAARPLFHPGLFPTIDNISVVRLEAMAGELATGQFPVRFSEQLGRGHGYMLFGYYAPLPFYVGAILNLIGVNLVGALKRTYLLSLILGSAGIFGLSFEFFGFIGAVVSVAAYVFSPFVGYDVFWRGGLGEVWAMGFVPWVLWLSFRAIRDGNRRDAIVAAVALSGMVLSHNLTAYMGIGFIALWMLIWAIRFRKNMMVAVGAGGAGLALSAFFWLPAFIRRGTVWVSYLQADKSKVFEGLLQGNPKEIFFPTFIPMITNWTALILPFVGWLVVRRRLSNQTSRYAASVLAVMAALSLFLVSSLSRPVWDAFYPVLYIFQFPWRFLTMVTIFGAVLTGGCVYLFRKNRWLAGLIVVAVLVFVNLPNYRPHTYEFVDKYLPQDPCGTSWGFEYLPVWVKTCLKSSWDKPYRIVSGDVTVSAVETAPRFVGLIADVRRESTLQIAQYDYPGWQVTVDGQRVPVTHDNDNGLIEFTVPVGIHTVKAVLRDTPVERWGMAVSLVAAAGLAAVGIRGIRGARRQRVRGRNKGV